MVIFLSCLFLCVVPSLRNDGPCNSKPRSVCTLDKACLEQVLCFCFLCVFRWTTKQFSLEEKLSLGSGWRRGVASGSVVPVAMDTALLPLLQ